MHAEVVCSRLRKIGNNSEDHSLRNPTIKSIISDGRLMSSCPLKVTPDRSLTEFQSVNDTSQHGDCQHTH